MRIASLLLLAAFCGLLCIPVTAASGGNAAGESKDGKTLFVESKCNLCHSVLSQKLEATVKSDKMKGPALDGVAERHEGEWIRKLLKKEVQVNDKDHKGNFKGSDEELQALVDWLLELKAD